MKKRRTTKATALKELSPAYHTNGNDIDSKLKFIDLFCGIGGFRLAFEEADCDCVFSSDWNEKAQETYEANFKERPHGDIYSVPDNAISGFVFLPEMRLMFQLLRAGVSKSLLTVFSFEF